MSKATTLIGAVGLGAGLMYILDPDRGNRRRALIRDKMARATNKTGDAFGATSRDISHRARGLAAEARSLFGSEEVSDEVLVERVRSKMGRVVSHPGSIEVTAGQGRVTLSGPILEREVAGLIKCVASVKGVEGIDNRLEVHKQAGNVPGLQGGSARPGAQFELMQKNWSPATRLIMGATGGALMIYCANRHDALGTTLGTLGFGIFLRGLTNTEMKRLVEAVPVFSSDPKPEMEEDRMQSKTRVDAGKAGEDENQPSARRATANQR